MRNFCFAERNKLGIRNEKLEIKVLYPNFILTFYFCIFHLSVSIFIR